MAKSVETEFAPMIAEQTGYRAFHAIAEDKRTLHIISEFTDHALAAGASRRCRDWLSKQFPSVSITPLNFYWS